MFICEVSGRLSLPGEKAFKLVTRTRQKTYTNKLKRGLKTIEITSHGWEIVEERTVCKEVYDKAQGALPNVVTNQSPIRTTHGDRPDRREQRQDKFQQRKKYSGRQGQKTNQVPGGQRTFKPVRAQQPNSNNRVSPVHKKPNSST